MSSLTNDLKHHQTESMFVGRQRSVLVGFDFCGACGGELIGL